MNPRIEAIEKALIEVYEAVCLLRNKPTERIEAAWRDKVTLPLEDIVSMVRDVDSVISSRKNRKLTTDLLRLPSDIRAFVEGR